MSFLAAIKPLLGTAAAFQVHLSSKDGKLSLLLLPQLAPAEEDEDAGVAAFRALLARPVKVEVPADADPDTYVVNSLRELSAVRGEAVSELDAYRTALTSAKDAAKAADEARRADAAKKSASPAKVAAGKSSKAPTPAAKTTASGTDTDADGESDNESENEDNATEAAPFPAPSSDTASPIVPAASAGQPNLFASLGL